jgi:nucleoside-diphosphate-sugar epimerase
MDRSLGIIAAMHAAVPPGLRSLDEAAICELQTWTRQLLSARLAAARQEYARFIAIGQRSVALPEAMLDNWLGGKSVLVTGGTGCIGSVLMRLIARRHPGRLVSVSRGVTCGSAPVADAEYVWADIRDYERLDDIVAHIRPDLIFHLAAQRDPGLAEREIRQTVTTNVVGTRNVLAVAAERKIAQVVIASTGKALRPYSPDVYSASKRAAEWLAWGSASRGETLCSAARFTHVVDNSIVHQRLLGSSAADAIRLYGTDIVLHGPDVAFYAQSALESAQLLLCAGLNAAHGEFRVHGITDLGWPVSLLDVALGVLARTAAATPIYFSGHEPGYESAPYPGLYDPLTAGEVSPLINAFEADRAAPSPYGLADTFSLEFAPEPEPWKRLQALEKACDVTSDPCVIRTSLDELSWSLLDAALGAVGCQALTRSMRLSSPHLESMSEENRRMFAVIRRHAMPDVDRSDAFHSAYPSPGWPRLASADGDRPGDHNATVLQLRRALPRAHDARLAAGNQQG